jgi:diguanylate cyclase (GGDEF)-like protein
MLGAAILAHSRPMRLSAELIEPLELLAGQAAATINAVDLLDELRRQVHLDRLTGLRNRAALDDAMGRDHDEPQTVLIADVDHFKMVNDQHGHLAGDTALCTFASELASVLPDLPFYRLGGDEFTCIFPGADSAAAIHVADAVSRLGRRVLSPWATSVTVGVALPLAGEEPVGTLARADAALLVAKVHARGSYSFGDPAIGD